MTTTGSMEFEIPEALQPQALLIHPTNLAQHLRTIIDNTNSSGLSIDSINAHILNQICTEAIPSSIYHVWLCIVSAHSPRHSPGHGHKHKHEHGHLILPALQKPSPGVRSAAIRTLNRRFHSKRDWKVWGWDVLGGAEAIKNTLDCLPLSQARRFLRAIFAHAYTWRDRPVAVACIEEFLGLVEKSRDWDTRSMKTDVGFLYAFCEEKKVVQMLRSSEPFPDAFFGCLDRVHGSLLRRIVVGVVDVSLGVRRDVLKSFRDCLLGSKEAYVPIHAGGFARDTLPAGVAFGLDLLSTLGKEPDLQEDSQVYWWIDRIVNLGIREKLPFESILPIIKKGLELARSRDSSSWLSKSLPRDVIQFWSTARFGRAGGLRPGLERSLKHRRHSRPNAAHQTPLEQCLIEQVLQIRDKSLDVRGNSATFTRFVCHLLWLVDRKGRSEFLRLLCVYSPTLAFDLTAWPPSEKEARLVPVWDYSILDALRPEGSRSLFERSLHLHHSTDFVPSPTDGGKQDSWNLSWEQQCFLWADWESSTPGTIDELSVTRKALSEMKTRAMCAREATDRLRWAESAISLAVRTASVDVFGDIVEWSKRFLRDPSVFPEIMYQVLFVLFIDGGILSCRVKSPDLEPVSRTKLQESVGKAHDVLKNLLGICLLLLREPWARRSINKITTRVPGVFASILSTRMNAVTKEPDLDEILLDSLIPVILDYEREGNQPGQTDVKWSGPAGVTARVDCPGSPNPAVLSFMDRLAKARNDFWEELRSRDNADVLNLGPGWPRGLPIQYLVADGAWLYHALERPSEAPYLASRANDVLFGSLDTLMTALPEKTGPIDGFVDSLDFTIRAKIARGNEAEQIRHVLRIWEYYSEILQSQPLYLELFRDFLVQRVRYEDVRDVVDIIRPRTRSKISAVPTGPGRVEWNPYGSDDGGVEITIEERKPKEVPCTLLNCRLYGRIPHDTRVVETSQTHPKNQRRSIWTLRGNLDASVDVPEAIILSALLFLDTYTRNLELLRTKFPDVDHPRYTPVYLASEFVTREANRKSNDPLADPAGALMRYSKRVPAYILRELIDSFLDTLQAEPNAPMYARLLFCTLDLIKVLFKTDQPQLAVDIVLRVWKDFPQDSSCHRQLSLVKLGRILPPSGAGDMMRRFTEFVCDALHRQQQQGEKDGKLIIKITTAKILAQVVNDADFLPQSTRMQLLRNMYNVSNHVDIRTEIAAALLGLVADSNSAEPYKVFASIALSAAAPNERVPTSEHDWILAERDGGPLPSVSQMSERPILDLVVVTAANKLPREVRADYVRQVLLPLLAESARLHTRWMSILVARLGLSLRELDLAGDIGPFSPNLIGTVLRTWKDYLPASYLQREHRSWALAYLHFASFDRIAGALSKTSDPALRDPNVRDHWNEFLQLLGIRPILYDLRSFLGQQSSSSLPHDMVIKDYIFRAEVIARNPLRYDIFLGRYCLDPGYTLENLHDLRASRVESLPKNPARRETVYNQITHVMQRVVEISEMVRQQGWSTHLASGYPVTLPSTLEYEIAMLPSPVYNPTAESSALDIFITSLIRLIHKYATNPLTLLSNLDALKAPLREVVSADEAAVAFRLGNIPRDERVDSVEIFVRVNLAGIYLGHLRKGENLSDRDVADGLVEEWKRCDVEMVRRVGWECAGDCTASMSEV